MTIFTKIKNELDAKIAKDEAEKQQQKDAESEKFSLSGILSRFFSGRIVISTSFKRYFGLAFFLWLLSIYYIKNRYDCEALKVEQDKLRTELEEVEVRKIIIIDKLIKSTTREAILKQLQEKNSQVADSQTLPIKVE